MHTDQFTLFTTHPATAEAMDPTSTHQLRADSLQQVTVALGNLVPFTHASMSAIRITSPGDGVPEGKAGDHHAQALAQWARENTEQGPVYVVLSYGTPIAVVTADRVAITARKYSPTTSRHTNLARQYLTATS